ncbi:MAG: response regulator [Candidatus Xenobia bacterium]
MSTILVVDDHTINRQFLTTLLGYQGHRLWEASSGEEALTLTRTERPDLAIIDLLMPQMDGYELARRWRSEERLAGMPIIFWSATYLEEEVRLLAQACGVTCILAKPCEPQAVLDAVAGALKSAPPPLPDPSGASEAFHREHVRLVGDKLFRYVEELEAANRELTRSSEQIRTLYEQLRDSEEQRRRLEEQFRHAQKMEAVGRLASGVAHDFNNVLTVITGFTHMAMERLAVEDPMQADLQEVAGAANRAASLTRQLLLFSRRQAVRPMALDLNEIVSDMEKMLRHLIGEDIVLVTALARDAGLILGDGGHVEQIVLNLAVNARDAMPQGGRLTIETAPVAIDLAGSQDHVGVPLGAYATLLVRDTGRGMDPETQERIFDPFFTTKATGTGLGLSTVYGIVAQCGGHIRVESAPGKGTTFRIYLPRREDAGARPAPGQEWAQPLQGTESILLVEDDAVIRRLMGRVLARYGYTVHEASDGAEALSQYGGGSPRLDLVVTDIVMPKVGGWDVVQRLCENHPDLKVIFISGYTDVTVPHPGFQDFMQKPFTPQALLRRIRDVMDASRPPATASGDSRPQL